MEEEDLTAQETALYDRQIRVWGVDAQKRLSKARIPVSGLNGTSIEKSINEKCRKSGKRIAFYAIECRDSCGEIFVDLQNYTYIKKSADSTAECQLNYTSFEEAISVPWKNHPRKVSKLYYVLRVIEKFELSEGRKPGELSSSDIPAVLKLKKEICDAQVPGAWKFYI